MKTSVIIPCYNRATVVAETLQCILRQSMPPDEIIAVDDGSTDNTVEVLESFGPRVRVLRQINAGPGAARNAGLAAASGEFVWFMDSDDLASLNKIEVQVQALERTGADIAIAPWVQCRLSGSRAAAETQILQQRGLPQPTAFTLASRWTILLQTALFRRSLLARIGGFDPSYLVAEDQLFFLGCLLNDARIVHTPECLVLYRADGGNKLTAGGLASDRRSVDWARYLLAARESCIRSGTGDPLDWFSFRLRLWCAWRDLSQCESTNASATSDQIAPLLGSATNRLGYALAQKSLRWLGGLRQRALGDRSPLALKAGPATRKQASLISDLGYSLS